MWFFIYLHNPGQPASPRWAGMHSQPVQPVQPVQPAHPIPLFPIFIFSCFSFFPQTYLAELADPQFLVPLFPLFPLLHVFHIFQIFRISSISWSVKSSWASHRQISLVPSLTPPPSRTSGISIRYERKDGHQSGGHLALVPHYSLDVPLAPFHRLHSWGSR
jgi:hypothetical protein